MDKLKSMDGQEEWTNAFSKRFGERVCVGVEYPFCWSNGKKFKPTKKEVNELWDDMIREEFGSKEQMMRNLEAEFGGVN